MITMTYETICQGFEFADSFVIPPLVQLRNQESVSENEKYEEHTFPYLSYSLPWSSNALQN